MARYYFCFNQISLLIANEHVLRQGHADATILYDSRRVLVPARYKSQRHVTLTRASMLLALFCSIVIRPVEVFVPHHRTGRIVLWIANLARYVGLVDDGLDTLRDVPKNIDLWRLRPSLDLLTFSSYTRFGSWTKALKIIPVCPIEILALDDRQVADATSRVDVIVVEAPGIRHRASADAYGCHGRVLLYVPHPSGIKRMGIPTGALALEHAHYSIEKSLREFKGIVVIGETMVLIFLLFCRHPGLRIRVEMRQEQYENLSPIHSLLRHPAIALELY